MFYRSDEIDLDDLESLFVIELEDDIYDFITDENHPNQYLGDPFDPWLKIEEVEGLEDLEKEDGGIEEEEEINIELSDELVEVLNEESSAENSQSEGAGDDDISWADRPIFDENGPSEEASGSDRSFQEIASLIHRSLKYESAK